jgi:hypothetical protein
MDDEPGVAVGPFHFLNGKSSVASVLPLFTLPAGALADAFNESRILRLANLWLAGSAGL